MSRYLRIAGVAALLAGLAAGAILYPSRPPELRQAIQEFGLDEEECRAFREARQETSLIVPETEEPVTVAEVARKLRLELAPLCRANALAADCGETSLVAGATLRLPLPAPRRRASETPR